MLLEKHHSGLVYRSQDNCQHSPVDIINTPEEVNHVTTIFSIQFESVGYMMNVATVQYSHHGTASTR